MRKFLILIIPLIISCQEKIDIFKLDLNESIENVIDFNDANYIGIETVEYPYSLLIEVEKSNNYKFDDIDFKDQKIYFQINSESLKTDSITKRGGAHINLHRFKNKNQLDSILRGFKAENNIYGVRIELKSKNLQESILKILITKYGKGTKNPNTDNGLYWSSKNKYIFYAPDYNRLIILNNINLSKTCYWDSMNGLIDFGGCNSEKYTQELLKNTTKAKDIRKPTIIIDNKWNVNGLSLDKSSEIDFLKSVNTTDFERMYTIGNKNGDVTEWIYLNNYNNVYFYFSVDVNDIDNKEKKILKGYSIMDFERVNISFLNNGLKKGTKFEDATKLFDKNKIMNYDELKFSNSIELKVHEKKVTLIFNDETGFSSMYIK